MTLEGSPHRPMGPQRCQPIQILYYTVFPPKGREPWHAMGTPPGSALFIMVLAPAHGFAPVATIGPSLRDDETVERSYHQSASYEFSGVKETILSKKKYWLFWQDVIEGPGKSIPEVLLMAKTLLFLLLTMCWAASACFGQAQREEKKLIQVKPSYHEASYVPPAGDQPADSVSPLPPTPREQMYIFWILGKMLSFPIDKTESFIRERINRITKGPEVKPAAASATANPFSSVNWKEIPPAPPARAAGVAKP